MIEQGSILTDTYRIIEEIGSGGGGIVYKAYHERLETFVVVKKIKDNVKDILKIRSEADILKNIKHTYLPRVYDFLEIDGEVFTVMDYIPGRSFAQALAEKGRFPQKIVLKWAGQLAEAMEYLHRQNPPIIHSDIKPANIMLTPEGNICLIDFNISLVFDSSMKTSTGISGGYSPPEQYRDVNNYRSMTEYRKPRRQSASITELEATAVMSELSACVENTEVMEESTVGKTKTTSKVDGIIGRGVDARSDVYSLGATLYHLLTGIKPTHDFEEVAPVARCGVPISEGFAHIIDKMMELLPERRYQDGKELSYALKHIYELDSDYKAYRKRKRKRKAMMVCLFLLSAGLMTFGAMTAGREKAAEYGRSVERAQVLILDGEFEAAKKELDKAMAVLPKRIEVYAKEAQRLYAMGEYENCIAYCKDIINQPDYSVKSDADEQQLGDIYYVAGNGYLETDDFTNASLCFEKAIENNDRNSLYFRDYAISEAKQGDFEAAESILKKAVDRGLGHDSVYVVQGEIALAEGDYSKAEENFKAAINSAHSEELKQRAVLMCAKAYRSMGSAYLNHEIALLEKTETGYGSEIPMVITERLADAYARKAKSGQGSEPYYYQLAAEKFESLYAKGYVTYQIMENIVVLYEETDNFQSARKMLSEMAERYPNDYRVYKRAAFLEADIQQQMENQNRDYKKFYGYYRDAENLYKKEVQKGSSDSEMEMLSRMAEEVSAGGWI